MTVKFQNKYRIPSARRQGYDYGQNGAYFITICTKNRLHFFGKIENGKMILNETGQLAEKFWSEIPIHFPFVKLGGFVVMPNHVHGILVIDRDITTVETLQCNVSTETTDPNQQMSNISPKPGTISTIIRSYKSVVTKYANHSGLAFGWQTRFHDHIIRNNRAYQRIENYIINNPKNWKDDRFFD